MASRGSQKDLCKKGLDSRLMAYYTGNRVVPDESESVMPESNRGIQLERLISLIREIAVHRNGISAGELAEILDVSKKTIQRYLNAITLELPLTFEKRGKEYFYFFSYKLDLPADYLNLDEILAILALAESSPHWQGTALHKSLASGISKLKQLISPAEMEFVRNKVLPFMVQKRGYVKYGKDWLEIFTNAIDDRKRLEVIYRGIGNGRTKKWSADPLKLIEHDQAFYAVVGVPRYRTVRILALSRVLQAETTDVDIKPAEYVFDEDSLKTDCFGIWIGEPQKIKVEFTDWAAGYVSERFWHPTQKITEGQDDTITIEFESGSIPEISRWVLSFGSKAKALAPKQLKSMVQKELRDALKDYKDKESK